MKIYETNEKQLVMEPAIRWAGNPNVVLSVKLLSVKIWFQVRIDGEARITSLFLFILELFRKLIFVFSACGCTNIH